MEDYSTDIHRLILFFKSAEKLKTTLRSGFTSAGRPESVTDHTWRLCLMAMLVQRYYPEIDFEKLIKICVIHDLGEAVNGDIPAPQQTHLPKSKKERNDYLELIDPLPEALKNEMIMLWDEYDAAKTPEAKLAKALDKLETILQHNQGDNPADFDYAFNLDYGTKYTGLDRFITEFRNILDEETRMNHLKTKSNQ